MSRVKIPATIALLVQATLLSACGQSSSSDVAESRGAGLDRCTLLTDEEVSAAIGAHHGGSSGSLERPGLWGAEGCRWTSVTSREIAGYGNWSDAIEVAVFAKARESWHRDQAEGDPVEGLGDGARYNETNGELWFNCGADRFCAIKAHTASADGREELARRLAAIVRGRMQSRS